MPRILLSFSAALIAVAVAVVPAALSAQCTFEHPKKAGKLQTNLVQAFLGCSSDPFSSCCGHANGTTEGGVPSCAPGETFNQLSGNPPHGWTWDGTKASGQVSLKASKTFPPNALNPPSNSADVAVQMKLKGVLDQEFLGPASGPGHLSILLRVTLDDRLNGDMTIVDFPAGFAFMLTGGKATVKSSIDAALNGASSPQPGLPSCSSAEVLWIGVADSNGNSFATAGLFNP